MITEWWKLQDLLEAEGWKFKGDMLVWPNGKCTPLLSASLTPEGVVQHVWNFVQQLKQDAPNLDIWKRGK
jgi:hypothetical protein